jgi:hypothetical protein
VKRGSLRFSEEQFRDEAAKRDRWKAATTPVGVGAVLENSVTKAGAAARETADALGHPGAFRTTPAPIEIPERDVLKEVLGALTYHPRVAWARRMNSGAAQIGGRWVKFGFEGCPDIIGMLRDGRTLCVEVKRAGKNPTQEQVEFLGLVHRNNGLAFVARSAADARNALNEYPEAA